jgi:hypothetical protein
MLPLSDEEIEQTAALLARLEPGFLPHPIFMQATRLVVTTTVELIVLQRTKEGVQVFVTRREDDDPVWPGMLHIPGTVLRPTDDATDDLAAPMQRLFAGELVVLDTVQLEPKHMQMRFRKTPRGTELVNIFMAEAEGYSGENWHMVQDLVPTELINDHHQLIMQAVDILSEEAA